MGISSYNDKFYQNPNDILRVENEFLEGCLTGLKLTNSDCLDFGCGTGVWSEFLCSLGASVCGVDADAAVLAHCRSSYPKIRFVLSKDGFLPFQGSAFDFILASWVFQELTCDAVVETLLKDLRRVIKPGGRFLLAENLYPDQRELRRRSEFGDIFANPGGTSTIRLFPGDSMAPVFLKIGFTSCNREIVGHSFFELFVSE